MNRSTSDLSRGRAAIGGQPPVTPARGSPLDPMQVPFGASAVREFHVRWVSFSVALWLAGLVAAAAIFCGPPALLIVAGAGGLAAERFLGPEVAATVVERLWRRVVPIERWQTVTRVGDCDDVPEGARDVERITTTTVAGRLPHHHRHHHGHRHTTTQRRCRWVMEDWEPVDEAVAEGQDADPRVWPAPEVQSCAEVEIGCERLGEGTETLRLALEPADRARLTCEVPEEVWSGVALGDSVTVPYGALSGQPWCSGLRVGDP